MRFFFLILMVFISSCCCATTGYINMSNYVVRKQHLDIMSNNIANADTIGFEEDITLSNKYNHKENKKKIASYVANGGVTVNQEQGQLRYTGRNLDFATTGGYFKLLTPFGYRYTLDGNANMNTDRELVNFLGYRYLSENDDPIVVALDTSEFYISQDGYIYSDNLEVARIGVFTIPRESLVKERNGLYRSNAGDTLSEVYAVLSGHLKESNVNIHKASVIVSEATRSARTSSSVLHDCANLELNVISKALK